MSYTIQGKEFQERTLNVAWYADAKRLVTLVNDYIESEIQKESKEIFAQKENFEKLTGGISFEDFAAKSKDEIQLEEINRTIQSNIEKYPDSFGAIVALNNYSAKLDSVKEDFVTQNSLVKSEYGIEKMTSNLKLIFKAQLEGDIESINYNTSDENEIFELIDTGRQALEDFFLRLTTLKKKLKISPLTSRVFKLTTNQI